MGAPEAVCGFTSHANKPDYSTAHWDPRGTPRLLCDRGGHPTSYGRPEESITWPLPGHEDLRRSMAEPPPPHGDHGRGTLFGLDMSGLFRGVDLLPRARMWILNGSACTGCLRAGKSALYLPALDERIRRR